MFADDTKIYVKANSEESKLSLQQDLNNLKYVVRKLAAAIQCIQM